MVAIFRSNSAIKAAANTAAEEAHLQKFIQTNKPTYNEFGTVKNATAQQLREGSQVISSREGRAQRNPIVLADGSLFGDAGFNTLKGELSDVSSRAGDVAVTKANLARAGAGVGVLAAGGGAIAWGSQG